MVRFPNTLYVTLRHSHACTYSYSGTTSTRRMRRRISGNEVDGGARDSESRAEDFKTRPRTSARDVTVYFITRDPAFGGKPVYSEIFRERIRNRFEEIWKRKPADWNLFRDLESTIRTRLQRSGFFFNKFRRDAKIRSLFGARVSGRVTHLARKSLGGRPVSCVLLEFDFGKRSCKNYLPI